jgi:ABC-type lipoprotein export system ATPase subunit
MHPPAPSDHGVVQLTGDDLTGYRRATVGFVFQHLGLMEMLTAAENVGLAAALITLVEGLRREHHCILVAVTPNRLLATWADRRFSIIGDRLVTA